MTKVNNITNLTKKLLKLWTKYYNVVLEDNFKRIYIIQKPKKPDFEGFMD